jgi:post-segregation antitoxin (ccd killing protein)
MKKGFNALARKRPVNLTLNEYLVRQAKAKAVEAAAAAWNRFNSDSGSIADQYSSL